MTLIRREALILIWISKGAALIRGWHLFETRRLLEEKRYTRFEGFGKQGGNKITGVLILKWEFLYYGLKKISCSVCLLLYCGFGDKNNSFKSFFDLMYFIPGLLNYFDFSSFRFRIEERVCTKVMPWVGRESFGSSSAWGQMNEYLVLIHPVKQKL